MTATILGIGFLVALAVIVVFDCAYTDLQSRLDGALEYTDEADVVIEEQRLLIERMRADRHVHPSQRLHVVDGGAS